MNDNIPANGNGAMNRRVLELLARQFPTAAAASTEIINLEAILNLPKGTEHFVADIHGEYEAFRHILKNASGNIRRVVAELFSSSMRAEDIRQLCTLIYYPRQKMELIRATEPDMEGFYKVTLNKLIKVLQRTSSKYTRSKVRKALPAEFAYIIEELLHEVPYGENKQSYYRRIIETIINTGQAESFIEAICSVIQRLSIDRLHILGDIYDRGPGAHIIIDTLENYRDYDIQWGNHDALWMGAAAGNVCSMANVLRISLRYANLETLEDGYGINLLPLATFAMETYADDPCEVFMPKISRDISDDDSDDVTSPKNRRLIAQMHKAIAVIQWKMEHALIARHPEWGMEGRNLLHLIDRKRGVVTIDGVDYPMPDVHFPTVDEADPYTLTPEEESLTRKLVHSFLSSEKLRRHIGVLLRHGSMYTICNSNLMYHASIPLNADGSLKRVSILGHEYSGPELLNVVEQLMRLPFATTNHIAERDYAVDYYWYLWCGPDSPLFDKAKMATFERYFLTDKGVRHEEKGFYYAMRDNEKVCDGILDAFGVEGQHRHIINGHVPVKAGKGEKPIKAGGKMMVIDGGFAKAYHDTTGIAGYTLVFHSRGFELVQHEPFTSERDAVANGTDILSTTQIVELNSQRLCVRHTDIGLRLQEQIDELRQLLNAYRLKGIESFGSSKV